MKCLYCQKELINPKARFCNSAEKMKFRRDNNRNRKTVTIVTEENNRNKAGEVITVTVVKTVTTPIKELEFNKETMEERLAKYKEIYGDSGFIPNWIRMGYNSKEHAFKHILSYVRKNTNSSLGLIEE